METSPRQLVCSRASEDGALSSPVPVETVPSFLLKRFISRISALLSSTTTKAFFFFFKKNQHTLISLPLSLTYLGAGVPEVPAG